MGPSVCVRVRACVCVRACVRVCVMLTMLLAGYIKVTDGQKPGLPKC